ncbi:putative reverse transcriptase domain-containing protein [Tanacetum coccineum]
MPPKSSPMTQAAMRRLIKESVDAAIAAEREMFMKCNPTVFHGIKGAVELRRWFKKTKNVFVINECAKGKKVRFAAILEGLALTWFNELALICPRMVELERVKVDAYIRGLTDNIKGEVTSSKPADLNETVRMAHKLMEQKSKVGHKARYYKEKSVATGANAQSVWTCYDCGEQGQLRSKGSVWVTVSSFLDIKLIKIEDTYEVELANRRIASTNVVLKGCTLSLVKHVFEINLMSIELGTFDVIMCMDWLVKHNVIIVILRIKARKYIERGCYLFLAHVMEKKFKEKRMEDVPIIRDFPEVFPEELPGLPSPRQVEFRIDLVLRTAPIARAPYRLASFEDERDEEENGKHLMIVLELLKKERLYAKFSKCDFWLYSIQFLGHVIDHSGVHVDPAKIKKKMNYIESEEEEAFQTLKQKLCSVPILALLEGTEYFMVYRDASLKGYGAVLMQRENKVFELGQRRWMKLLSDYDCEIRYHPGKANVVAGALSQKERDKPLRVQALLMTVHNDLPKQIHESQEEVMKRKKVWQNLGRLIKPIFEFRPTGTRCFESCLLPVDLVIERFGYSMIRIKASGLLQPPEIPVLAWEEDYYGDFVSGMPRCIFGMPSGYDNDLVYCRSTDQISLFLAYEENGYHFTLTFWRSLQKALGTNLDMSTTYRPQTDGQSERTIQTLEDMLRACMIYFGSNWDHHLPVVEFSHNNSYHASIKVAPYEVLYERECRSPVCWSEVGDSQLTGPELIYDTTEKIVQIKNHLLAAYSRQKSYADRRLKPLEFEVGDMVLLKILARVGHVAYTLELPEELKGIHSTFHISNLKNCLAEGDVVVPM